MTPEARSSHNLSSCRARFPILRPRVRQVGAAAIAPVRPPVVMAWQRHRQKVMTFRIEFVRSGGASHPADPPARDGLRPCSCC